MSPYRIVERPNAWGYLVAVLVDANGVEREANAAEVWLWNALQEALKRTPPAAAGNAGTTIPRTRVSREGS